MGLETGVVVAVTLWGADEGDTTALKETFIEAVDQMEEVGRSQRRTSR